MHFNIFCSVLFCSAAIEAEAEEVFLSFREIWGTVITFFSLIALTTALFSFLLSTLLLLLMLLRVAIVVGSFRKMELTEIFGFGERCKNTTDEFSRRLSFPVVVADAELVPPVTSRRGLGGTLLERG